MRVSIAADTFPPNRGGSEYYLSVLATGLAARGYAVTVYTAALDPQGWYRLKGNIIIKRIPFWAKLHEWGGSSSPLLNRIARLALYPFLVAILFARTDVFIAGHVLPAGVVGAILRRLGNTRRSILITYGEEITMYKRSPRMARLLRRALRGADFITTLTEESRIELDLIEPGTLLKTQAIPPSVRPIDKSRSEQYLNTNVSGFPFLFTLSRLVERKGIDTVIEAVFSLKTKFPTIQYVVAGEGPDRCRLEELVSRLKLQDHVHFLGSIDDPHQFLEICDMFCMPNRMLENGEREGFGIVFLEAGLRSKPSIAGNSGGAVDAVLHEKTGLLVSPGSVAETAAAIDRLANDKSFRLSLGTAAREYAETFTEERLVNAFDHAIRRLTSA